MMELQRQISRKLYEEHVAVLGLLSRFEKSLARLRAEPPAADDPVWSALFAQLATALEYEITRHFDLEEEQLFPRLHQRGEDELAELLFEEHETIRAVTRPLLGLIERARAAELDAAGWRALKAAGLELVERLGSHAEKEQGALVPLVDEMLDEATDAELFAAYAMS
jgi:hemerythrin-like domain-containing protein